MAATMQDILDYIARTPLGSMGGVVTALADKVYAHRLENKGYVPTPVFEQLLGPVTVSVQIVHQVFKEGAHKAGFALCLRDGDKAGIAYQGKYHNACTTLRWSDDLRRALHRSDEDALDGELSREPKYLGVTYHHEPSRRNMDLTFVYRRCIWVSDLSHLKGTWRLFSNEEINAMVGKPDSELPIVASNLHQILWVMNANRARFGVLTETFPPKLLV